MFIWSIVFCCYPSVGCDFPILIFFVPDFRRPAMSKVKVLETKSNGGVPFGSARRVLPVSLENEILSFCCLEDISAFSLTSHALSAQSERFLRITKAIFVNNICASSIFGLTLAQKHCEQLQASPFATATQTGIAAQPKNGCAKFWTETRPLYVAWMLRTCCPAATRKPKKVCVC